MPEAAEALGISTATAERYWAYARAWLYCDLSADQESARVTRRFWAFRAGVRV